MPRTRTPAQLALLLLLAAPAWGQRLLVPMDEAQADHLRAYGLTHWCLDQPREYECEWLINYRYGAFVLPDTADVRARAAELGVTVQPVGDAQMAAIYALMARRTCSAYSVTRAAEIRFTFRLQ